MPAESVLIIDDDQQISRLLSSTLHTFGIYNISQAFTWEQALEQVERAAYELIFLDINLVDRTSWELLEIIRTRSPNSFVTMFSGESTLDNVRKAISLGAGSFIVKPFNYEKIQDVLKKFESFLKSRPIGGPLNPSV